MTPNGKTKTFQASWVGVTIVANPGRACTNAAQPPRRPRFCTPGTCMATTFENVTVLHDTKPTFTFSNPRLLLQAALLYGASANTPYPLARTFVPPPTSPRRPMARGALVRLQGRDGSRTSDNEPSLVCRASASISGCVRKSLLRLRPSACLTRDHRLVAAIAMRQKTHCAETLPPLSRANPSRFRPHYNLILPRLISVRCFRYNTPIPRGER